MKGYNFHRQKPLLNYIADFYCSELNLVVEIDEYSHNIDAVFEKNIKKGRRIKSVGD